MLENLIRRAQEGNTEAFHELYDELSSKTFLFIRARTRTREDALDMFQETFIEFWKSLPQFSFVSEPALYAFLYTLARRKISRHYRAWFWQKEIPIEDENDIIIIFTEDDDETLRAESKFLLGKLRALSKKDREVLELRYLAGLPFGDIAVLVGDSENALKVRHHRALIKLKQIYEHGTR